MEESEKRNLRIIPLGGLGEIGLNMTAFEFGGKILLVDCGLMFPKDYMLGVDIVIPDFTFIEDRQDDILALIITHGHEDHIGAIPYLFKKMKFPLYGSDLSLALIREKLEEHKISGVSYHAISSDRTLAIGEFRLEFIRVCHSIMDGYALGITTPAGTVVHTGDFKLDFDASSEHATDIRALAKLGERGVLCLMSDSTNVEQIGYTLTEDEIGKALDEVFRDAGGRIIITLFASNVARIQQVFQIAENYGRKVVINGRSMISTVRIARRLGYLKVSDAQILDIKDLPSTSRRRVVILTTGSQGEPMSALTRIAMGNHNQIQVVEGDTVLLSSKFIPGNEGAISNLINELFKQGAQVVYETISQIHTSGHAHREELKLMLKLIRPKYFIPIHGELRHLVQHAYLARDMGVKPENCILAKNGEVVQFTPDRAGIVDTVMTGRVFVDGKGVGDVSHMILTDRRLLSESGVVVCSIAYREEDGELVAGPEIQSRGCLYEPESPELLAEALEVARESFERLRRENLLRTPEGTDQFARDVRRLFNKRIQRRPIVIPVFIPV